MFPPIKERLKKNTLTTILFFMVSVPLLFVITPMILKYVGKEVYGIWAMVWAILVFFEFIGLQAPSAMSVLIPKYDPDTQAKEINEIANTVFVFFLFMALLTAGIFTLGKGWLLNAFFKVTPNLVATADFALSFCVYAYLINFVILSFAYVLGGFNLFYINNIIKIGALLIRTGLMIFALIKGWGIQGIVIVQMATILLETVAIIIWGKAVYKPLQFNPLSFNFKRLSQILRMSVKFMVSRVAQLVNGNIDKIALGFFLTPVTVAYYQIGSNISKYISNVPEMFSSGSIEPAASELSSRGEKDKFLKYYERINKYIFAVAFFLLGGMVVFGREFILLWLGPGYEQVYTIMVVLAAVYTVGIAGNTATYALNGFERFKEVMLVSGVAAVINVLLSVGLSKYYGLKGALTGTAISVVSAAVVTYYIFRKISGYGIGIIQVFVKPFFAVLLTGVGFFLFEKYLPSGGWGIFIIKGFVFTILFAVLDILVFRHFDAYDFSMLKENFGKKPKTDIKE